MDGETAQVSGFIASFDKDGKLLAHKTVIPEVNWDLFYAALANEGFYLYDAQFRKFILQFAMQASATSMMFNS